MDILRREAEIKNLNFNLIFKNLFKIQYDLFENRAKLVFNTAWELANMKKRIVVDKNFD